MKMSCWKALLEIEWRWRSSGLENWRGICTCVKWAPNLAVLSFAHTLDRDLESLPIMAGHYDRLGFPHHNHTCLSRLYLGPRTPANIWHLDVHLTSRYVCATQVYAYLT